MSGVNRPELLSPAGSMESLKAAVNGGCDAVYLGGKQFSARQYAGNFDLKELEDACDYCHLRGVKVYVTVNTVYKDEELAGFLTYIRSLYEMGVDALIMQDTGAERLVKAHFPDFPLHASTQMTCNSLADVKYWEGRGFDKIVLSRELSLEEIRHITENTEAEIETFVHGALCVCYSGQCIMSSMLGGRSGNRGRCAQTCRLPYTLYKGYDSMAEGYLLSPKDVMTVEILPQLIEAGIASLKIEGRMKSPEYVAGVTRIYRKYIDLYFENPEEYKVDPADIKALQQLFNRGGFTEGYYTSFAGREMMSIERPKSWGLKVGIVDKYLPKYKKVTIRTREPLVPGDGLEIWTQTEPHVGTNVSKHSKAGEVITITLEGDINKNDVVYRTFGKALQDELKKTYEKDTRKLPIYGMLRVKEGEPISLQLWDNGGNSIFVSGSIVEPAGSSPMLPMKLRENISKMGATPFVLADLQTDIDRYIYVNISEVNRVRRAACEALEAAILKKSKRKAKDDAVYAKPEKQPMQLRKKLTAVVTNMGQLDAVLQARGICRVYYEAAADLDVIYSLPGRKILLGGNHDYWWKSSSKLEARYPGMRFLKNNFDRYADWHICGTRGWLCPNDVQFTEQDKKIYEREQVRLRLSLDAAMRDGAEKIILMMHFPPMNDKQEDSAFTALFREYPIKKVIYGHLHGAASHKTAFEGKREGIDYALIAADYIAFCPRRIL